MQNTIKYAQDQDQADPLKAYRDQFHLPKINGETAIYLVGNSLGAQPKTVRQHIEQELLDWQNLGVEAHFDGKNAWYYYHHFLTETSAKLVGALPSEVVIMNSLTVNLHLMMVSFYRPTAKRFKILIESDAFPSDKYAVASQAALQGFDPDEAIIKCRPRAGEHCLRNEDIIAKIEECGDELALVLLGGVNYYTGQVFDFQAITEAGHHVGAKVGFDLAHAAGNIPMKLHDWEVDFAVWCSYKYLNAGPGSTSGVFVHEKHGNNTDLLRFSGWWGNDEKTRFEMQEDFVAQKGAAGWQLSNAPVLPMAAFKASLEIFAKAGMTALRQKSEKLTGYMEFLLHEILKESTLNHKKAPFQIITPSDPKQRGCQLSILVEGENGRALFDFLTENGVIADWRNPNVIRVAPVPLYNTFEEVFRFVDLIKLKLKA